MTSSRVTVGDELSFGIELWKKLVSNATVLRWGLSGIEAIEFVAAIFPLSALIFFFFVPLSFSLSSTFYVLRTRTRTIVYGRAAVLYIGRFAVFLVFFSSYSVSQYGEGNRGAKQWFENIHRIYNCTRIRMYLNSLSTKSSAFRSVHAGQKFPR